MSKLCLYALRTREHSLRMSGGAPVLFASESSALQHAHETDATVPVHVEVPDSPFRWVQTGYVGLADNGQPYYGSRAIPNLYRRKTDAAGRPVAVRVTFEEIPDEEANDAK
jgi:hypothetical protein